RRTGGFLVSAVGAMLSATMDGRRFLVSRALVVAVAAAMLAIALLAIAYRLSSPSDGTRAGYVTSSLSGDGLAIERISGADTPLRTDDRVVAVDGADLDAALFGAASASDAPRYAVDRNGERLDLRVPMAPYPLGDVLLESWGTLLFCLAMLGVSVYVFALRPGVAAAGPLLLQAAGLTGSTVPWLLGFQAIDIVRGTGFWLWLAGAFAAYSIFWSAALHLALVFPRRLRGVSGRVIAAVYLVPALAMTAWISFVGITRGSLLDGLGAGTFLQLLTVLLVSTGVVAGMVAQYRGATIPAVRSQVGWLAWGAGLALSTAAAGWFVPELLSGSSLLPWSAIGLSGLSVPLSIAIAVLRHRLFDIDVVVNRTLVYGCLSVAVVVVYVASVALLRQVLPRDSFAASLLATGAAALVALPVRDSLQRWANRLMYGDRDEPYRAITRLGERLSTSLTTDEILPAVVTTVAGALRLPYAAIELGSDAAPPVAAAVGEPKALELTRIPLLDAGETVGALVVAPRSPGESFSGADWRLLTGLANEAGRVVRSVGLLAEIDASRRALVAAREEERRRLRRDLHDGLGPAIAAARLKVEAAGRLVSDRPGEARAYLEQLDGELGGLLDEVRRIARDLRPPVLDELGLLPALRAQAARLTGDDGPEVRIEAPADLPPLPAAVEAAAYWIAVEALTNASRHSGAAHCSLRVSLADALEVEVEDDGAGVPRRARSGVGMLAMRERAREVGGTLHVERPRRGSGTVVRARLPLLAGAAS
ncbi:MAG TPA: histidine kinase, partial [Candidatus Limnocylindria bacterium]|nr:histidine kinase [Candidatus Limnocylindria bacterium]